MRLQDKKGPAQPASSLNTVSETKRWATDIQEWGTREGTGEALITAVAMLDRRGLAVEKAAAGEELTIRVHFKVQEEIENVHFGAAIFRQDGVYCYGPNSKLDGLSIPHLSRGKGYFEITYKEFLLMPGIYYLSVAIWDENERFAYDYHKGFYKIEVSGTPVLGQLVCLPQGQKAGPLKSLFKKSAPQAACCPLPPLDALTDKWNTESKDDSAGIDSVKFTGANGAEESVFVTGQDMKVIVEARISQGSLGESPMLWMGVHRSDGIYCHGAVRRIDRSKTAPEVFDYKEIKFLPGGYKVSAVIFDERKNGFIAYSHGRHSFKVVSQIRDHGTVYMKHSWAWKFEGGKIEDKETASG